MTKGKRNITSPPHILCKPPNWCIIRVTGWRFNHGEKEWKTEESINDLSMNWLSDTQFFEDIKVFLSEPVDVKRLSSESLPAPNPIDWKNGDAFAFPLRSEIAKKYHIENRYAVIWKIYDEAKTWRKQAHIVYLSVCEQDRIPKTCEDMLNLGFIPPQPRYGLYT